MITIRHRPQAMGRDHACADYDGERYEAISRHGAVMAVARLLVAAGAADQPWQALGLDGSLGLSGKSLLGLARLTVTEGDKCGPRIVPYVAMNAAERFAA